MAYSISNDVKTVWTSNPPIDWTTLPRADQEVWAFIRQEKLRNIIYEIKEEERDGSREA